MLKPAIVIIAYNRAKPLERLLSSIAAAGYPADGDIPLVISIDKSDDTQVAKAAEHFRWKHGRKQVIKRGKRMGLKAHVLSCSALAETYGSAIILEDDLYVATDFYHFAAEALEFTSEDERIAGVSLYEHRLNVHAREPFEHVCDGSDCWYFSFASSWGQAYTAGQWRRFSDWLEKNDNTPFSEAVPQNVSSWSDSSWLKYFIRYCIEEGKYFLYPSLSRSTNFSEEGTHSMGQAADLQVPLSLGDGCGYRFTGPDVNPAVYDGFFESVYIKRLFDRETVIDLYGTKPVPQKGRTDYLLSSRSLPYRVVKSYGRLMRPLESNIINDIPGEDFFLYDLREPGKAPHTDRVSRLLYNYRAFKAKYGIMIGLKRLLHR